MFRFFSYLIYFFEIVNFSFYQFYIFNRKGSHSLEMIYNNNKK